MKFVGYNLNKINAERISDNFEKIKIDTKIEISKIEKFETKNFPKELIKIDFVYTLDYSPKFAKLDFNGFVLFSAEENEIKDLIKSWKDKKIEENFQTVLFNIILKKTNLKALELENELNIPFHINMPSLKKKE